MYAHPLAGSNDHIHGDENWFDAKEVKIVHPDYCDYIADLITQVTDVDAENLVASFGGVKFDLHPKGGYLLSTKKFVYVTDKNCNIYKITVEAV